MENFFEDYKGVVVFYLLVAILAILFTIRIDKINSQARGEENKINETYYA